MAKQKILGFLLLLIIGFSGCSNKTLLTSNIKQQITSIEIDTNILLPKLPTLLTKTNTISGSFGLIGSLIGGAPGASDREKLKLYLEKHSINFKNIYNKELKKTLKKNKFFSNKIVDKNGKYKLISSVTQYGLIHHHNILNSEYKPIINAKLVLIDKIRGTTVWENSEYITSWNDKTISKEFDEYFTNPSFIALGLKQVSSEVIKLLIKNIEQ